MKKELATAQQKLRLINKLSNTLAPESELTSEQRAECAYLIHRIVESNEITSDIMRDVTSFQIESNRSFFVES